MNNAPMLRVSVAGQHGSGKLTLLHQLLPILRHEFKVSEIYEFPMTVCVDLELKVLEPEEQDYLRECLPPWAESYKPDGVLQVGRQLCTKDGRRMGNAFVTKGAGIISSIVAIQAWEVVTDAGNVLKLTTDEINELFYIGHYIAKPNSIPGLRNLKHEPE